MDLRVEPGSRIEGEATVPGDKSIAHRWLMAAATARGRSSLIDLPPSLDVRSTARVMGGLVPNARPPLDLWARNAAASVEGGGSTWNADHRATPVSRVEVEGEGRDGMRTPHGPLDCGNSGTTMRLVSGLVAASDVTATLVGDESLSVRPMERIAEPLRRMGAHVETDGGHPPVTVSGGSLTAIEMAPVRPSAQVKSAIILAALQAEGVTTIAERVPTRDHTERLFRTLGAPLDRDGDIITVARFQHEGFEGAVPGDPSSAVFLLVAAALSRGSISVDGVGLNPTRLHVLEVMARMGVVVEVEVEGEVMGEPFGRLTVVAGGDLKGTRVEPDEIPLVIDEIPALAALAAHARGETWFLDAGELRVKESDRLSLMATSLRALGGHAADEGDDLVIAGTGLNGGSVDAGGDHRIAMAMVVAGLAASGEVTVRGAHHADVSFPGFARTLHAAGARVEPA